MTKPLLALPLLLCACATDLEVERDLWTDVGKGEDPNAGGVASTHVANARLLDGFNKLIDSTADACVVPADEPPLYVVGGINKTSDLYFISSKEDLARTLGIDLGLQVRYGTTSVGPTVAFLDSFKQSRSAMHLLLSARASYHVTNLRPVSLTGNALEWLGSDPRQFLARCGNLYINGVEYEAQLSVLIRIEALTEDATRELGTNLAVGTPSQPIGLDATVKAKLETLAKRSDVVVETHVLDRGLRTDGATGALIASLLVNGISEDMFTKFDTIRGAMVASLSEDACRDGGSAVAGCSGEAPGYFENTTRDAVAVRLDLRPYTRAKNAPLGGPGTSYETMRDWLAGADRTLRTLSRSARKLDTIRDTEVLPFLAAPPERQAFYGIAPPAAPVASLSALVALARTTNDAFDRELHGSVAAELNARIATCFAYAAEGAPDACATMDASTADADTAIARYLDTARIVPLRVSAKGVHGYIGARDACNAVAMRLPTSAEAERLAMPIGYGALERTSEERLRYAAWHSDTAMCTAGQVPALANPPGGTMQSLCTAEGWLTPHPTTTLCVPPGGPFDQLAAP